VEWAALWQPRCYVLIGGLAVATFIALLLVPSLYSIADRLFAALFIASVWI
jgi:multidrug efflux pump subunit AcrB